ncbi:MAG TPA: hypothetical protein VFF66_04370 [Brevundimonas sp.]|nr:hypothetical protein [Brevundimonas sp.]
MADLPETDPEPDARAHPGHRIHPPETWDRARDDYLAGLSGPAVCARYGLGLAAFRKRAAAGGWRRIDQPPPLPTGPLEIDGDLDQAGYFDLAEMTAIHLREAIVNGSVGQAEAWLRLHLRLHDACCAEFAQLKALGADDEPVDEVDGIDGRLPPLESTPSPGTGLASSGDREGGPGAP